MYKIIGNEEYEQTNRSRSEGSTRREKRKNQIKVTSSEPNTKMSIHNNNEARRKDIPESGRDKTENLIYTFRENNEGSIDDDILGKIDTSFRSNYYKSQTIDTDIKEKSIKMSKKDLFSENERFSTITRNNETFAQTLLSLKHGKNEFRNTGKHIENMNENDFNIMKSFQKTGEKTQLSDFELRKSSYKHRSISTKRVSRTERRDGVRGKSKKSHPIVADEVGMEEDSKAFTMYIELHKKYNKLKRHYRKEKR
jgi:hypothetical protein